MNERQQKNATNLKSIRIRNNPFSIFANWSETCNYCKIRQRRCPAATFDTPQAFSSHGTFLFSSISRLLLGRAIVLLTIEDEFSIRSGSPFVLLHFFHLARVNSRIFNTRTSTFTSDLSPRLVLFVSASRRAMSCQSRATSL